MDIALRDVMFELMVSVVDNVFHYLFKNRFIDNSEFNGEYG